MSTLTLRDFDNFVQSEGRPTAVLGGRKWDFRSPSKMSWSRWNKLMISLEERGTAQEEVDKTKSMLVSLVIKDQREAFAAMLDNEGAEDDEEDDSPVIANAQVGELISWLLEQYSGKAQTTENESSVEPPLSGEPLKSISIKRTA